jgi:hypothetical protein
VAVSLRALSGSTHGAPVKVAATSIGSGTTVHTATADATEGKGDQVYLYATNTDTVARTLTVGWGGTTDPDHLVIDAMAIPPNVTVQLPIPGLLLRNSLVVRAAASAADVILVTGFVHRHA